MTPAELIRGCLLGVPSATPSTLPSSSRAGHRSEPPRPARGTELAAPGRFTDDTQMSLFTAEGLIRARVRQRAKGNCHPPTVIHHAYLRWLHPQGHPWDERTRPLDGWLVTDQRLHRRQAPGSTCLSTLPSGIAGTTDHPVNESAP